VLLTPPVTVPRPRSAVRVGGGRQEQEDEGEGEEGGEEEGRPACTLTAVNTNWCRSEWSTIHPATGL